LLHAPGSKLHAAWSLEHAALALYAVVNNAIPGEEALLPDIRPALAAALLAGAGLEGQAAVAALAGRWVIEQLAQVDEMLLGDAALFAGVAASLGGEGLRGERWQHRVSSITHYAANLVLTREACSRNGALECDRVLWPGREKCDLCYRNIA
jgi:hypothetical protein